MMKFKITCAFNTDDDYVLDKKFVEEYKDYLIDVCSDECEKITKEIYRFSSDTENCEDDYLPYPDFLFRIDTSNIIKAKEFLEKLSVSFRVGYTHRWLQRELYDLVDHALEFINKFLRPMEFFEYINGNYEGTYIDIVKHFENE